MSPATRLVLLRHGQTDWNLQGRYQGHADIGLNDVGREQAQVAGELVGRLAPDVVFSSDLLRAVDTATAVAGPLGLPVVTDPRLREINVGQWSGRLVSEVAAADLGAAAALRRGEDIVYGHDGESPSEVARRMFDAVSEYDLDFTGGTVLVVSHGMSIRLCVAALLGIDLAHSRVLGSISNCGWTILSHSAGHRWRLEAYDRIAQ